MKLKGYAFILLVCITFILLILSPHEARSASDESATGVGNAQKDQETLEKFSQKAPGKIDELDSKLAEALILYYDGKYGQALPIFNEIASEVETTDIMWWIGTSAMNTGDLNLAVRKYQQMLAVDPKLYRVRLELATAYFQLGRYQEARQELETVKASNPPDEVRANIDRLLAAIEDAARKLTWNIRFSQGILWDSNVSAGPDNRIINAGGGSTFTLNAASAKVGDTGYATNLSANVLYKFGEQQGPMWNTSLDYYNLLYNQYAQYDYSMIDMATGPWWVGRDFILKVPFGYMIQYYGDDRQGYLTPGEWLNKVFTFNQNSTSDGHQLSNITHIDPSLEYFFNKYLSLKGAFTYSSEVYTRDSNNGFNNQTRRLEVGPNIYLFNRQHIFSITGGLEAVEAHDDTNTYDNRYYAVSYFMRFPTRTEVFLKFQQSFRNYKDKPVQWWYTEDRKDQRTAFSAVLSQSFFKNFFASVAYNYIDNNSNADLYTFDKQTYTFSIGVYF